MLTYRPWAAERRQHWRRAAHREPHTARAAPGGRSPAGGGAISIYANEGGGALSPAVNEGLIGGGGGAHRALLQALQEAAAVGQPEGAQRQLTAPLQGDMEVMGSYGVLWGLYGVSMGSYGVLMGVYGGLWGPMQSYGALWSPMQSYGGQ